MPARSSALSEGELIDGVQRSRRDRAAQPLRPALERRSGSAATSASAPWRCRRSASTTVAAQVNAHPEVAHNYERDHALNMWFVLAAERPERIAEVIARDRSGDRPQGLSRCRRRANSSSDSGWRCDDARRRSTAASIAATQAGLPLVARALSRRRRDARGRRGGGDRAAAAAARRRRDPPHRRDPQSLCARPHRQRHVGVGRGRRRGRRDSAPRSARSISSPIATSGRATCRCGPTTCSPWCTAARATKSRTRSAQIAALIGAGRARPRHPVFHPHPEEDRTAHRRVTRRRHRMFRLTHYLQRDHRADAGRAAARRRRARW